MPPRRAIDRHEREQAEGFAEHSVGSSVGCRVEMFPLPFPLMSAAQIVREQVAATPVRGFVAAAEIPGSRHAVECELSRLAAAGELVRARKGLYWKGPKTRVGMPFPHPGEVAIVVAGIGAGPAELSAAHLLGLTSQVPAVEVIAVPGRTPAPVRGARFVSRSIDRRILGLRPAEIAIIEVLRAGPQAVEVEWAEVGAVVERLVSAGEVRVELVAEQVRNEHHIDTRERWVEIVDAARITA
jgi:hypothetical protein